jgi:predicted transglutaminase-like cysteine proteinase
MAAEARTVDAQPANVAAGPDMLGTSAVAIHAERFGDSLKRAREDASHSPTMQRMVAAARPLAPLQQLAFVQQVVNSRIHWISDATQWGQHDYWASAAQTLSRGAGDMEDRAIVKLQALRALGFNKSDLFLTLARDRVGGPLTVVTVRSGGHYYVLDDTGGSPFAVEQRRFELEPIISFGLYGAWVHVRPTAIASAGARTATLARK